MVIFKSINQNHANLPDEVFWTKDRWTEHVKSPNNDWIRLTRNLRIRYIDVITETDQIQLLLDEEISSEKNLFSLTIIKQNEIDAQEWKDLLLQYVEEFSKSENFNLHTLQYFMIGDSDQIINPFTNKLSLVQRIRASKINRIQKKYKALENKLFLIQNNIEPKDVPTLLKQSKVNKPEKFDKWKSRLNNRGHSTKNVLEMSGARVRRNHYSVNSNFNKSGKLIVTDENLILIRRKFNLFGLSLGALLPLVAFVRPANKVIILIRILMSYLRIPIQLIKGLKPALPAIGGLFVSISFINLDKFNSLFSGLSSIFGFRLIGPSVDYVVKNPESIPAFFGLFTLFRLLVQRFLLRSEEIVILPHNLCTQLLIDGNQLIGRWKVKGSNTVKANNGLQYRFAIQNYNVGKNDLFDSSELIAQNIFNIIMGNIPDTIELQYEDEVEAKIIDNEISESEIIDTNNIE